MGVYTVIIMFPIILTVILLLAPVLVCIFVLLIRVVNFLVDKWFIRYYDWWSKIISKLEHGR